MDWLIAHSTGVRLTAFAGILLAMAGWENVAMRRNPGLPRARRWMANLGLVVLNTIAVRLIFPAGAVGVAMVAANYRWGIMNIVDLPYSAGVVLAVVIFDLAIYFQHVMFHAVPVLWKLHMVHHADIDFDVTTGIRFHPLEILISMGIKSALVILIGPPVVGVLLFEILLNATSMFNHGNVRMPGSVDRVLRLIVVTPDMHRVHHSVEPSETNSNFGFNLPWWDRLFGTYKDQPAAGHIKMRIGLSHLQDTGPQGLGWMLILPFVSKPGTYPINRRWL